MKEQAPKQPASGKANPSPSEPVGNGASDERLRRACEIIQCVFSDALQTCDNDILAWGDVADGLCEILNCDASFSDCEIDRELRRIAIESGKENIEKFIKGFSEGDIPFEWIFTGEYIDAPQEIAPQKIRAKKINYIVEYDTREFRRTMGLWLYYSRAKSMTDLKRELRRKCQYDDRQLDVAGNFVTVPMLRKIAFIANAEARRSRMDLVRSIFPTAGGAPVARPNPSVVNITAERVNVQAGTVETPEPNPPQGANPSAHDTANPPEPKRNAGHTAGGVSQAVMAGFMGVVKKTVCRWENHPDKYPPPIVDGKQYEKGIRENGAGAFVFAQRYKDTQQGAVKITRGAGAIGIAEKQVAESWIRDNLAALRSVGADLSEW